MNKKSKDKIILSVAINNFAKKGFAGTSIRDIAKASNVTLPTIYHYFGNKRSLYMTSCIHVFSKSVARHHKALKNNLELNQKLYNYYTLVAKDLISDPHYSKLLLREFLEQDSSGLKEITEKLFKGSQDEIYGICKLICPNRDPVLLAHALHMNVFGMAQLKPIGSNLHKKIAALYKEEEMMRYIFGVCIPELDWSTMKYRTN